MSDGSWDDALSGYKRAQTEPWGEDFIWMEKLLAHLIAHRDLSKLYPIASHFRLITFIGESFELVYNKPVITIQLSHEIRDDIKDKYRYKFSLTTGAEDGELFREHDESVYCSFERSLEVFDEMFAKLERVSR